MATVTAEQDTQYLADFEAATAERAGEPEALGDLRRRAIERFGELGFPTMREEDWRFTNVGAIARTTFERAAGPGTIEEALVDRHRFEGTAAAVFVDGHFVPELSRLDGIADGVRVTSIREAIRRGEAAVEQLGAYARFDSQPFVALNTALFTDGALVVVDRDAVVEEPIHLLFVATGGDSERPRMSYPRTLVVAGEHSQATIVESYVGQEGDSYFTCPVTELVAGPASVVDHYRVQRESTAAYHVALQRYECGRSANFSSHSLSFGGGLVRNDIRGGLDGEGIDCTLNGLYLTKGRQHVDNHMWVEHRKPHCSSHELYKGILEGRSRAVFNGLIHVFEDAQKTDAKQTNRNLLLSSDSLVNTNPQLLIYADDVKCTHGSTVGQLDEDALFYLRSRGIGIDAAKSLLVYAFASEVVDGIAFEPVRRELEEFLFARLPKGDVVRQAV